MIPSVMTAANVMSPGRPSFHPVPSRPHPVRAASSTTVEFSESLRSQCAEVASTLPAGSGLTLTCAAMPERLPRAVATRLTVIAMELIAGALTAFEGGRGGRIEVSFRPVAAAWELRVEHSGSATPAACSRAAAGAAVIRVLVARLGGRIERRTMIGGARAVVTVPCPYATPTRPQHLTLVPPAGD